MTRINSEIIDKVVGNTLDEYFNENRNVFPDLYKRCYYEMIEFLKDKDNKILFINIPIEELSDNDNGQENCWIDLCNFIVWVQRISLKKDKFDSSQLGYREGDESWYKVGDFFLLVPENNNQHNYYYLSAEKFRDGKKITFRNHSLRGEGNIYNINNEQKKALIQNAKSIYRICRIPDQLNAGFSACENEIKLLEICNPIVDSEFKRATLMCSPCPQSLSNAGKYVYPIVTVLNANGRVQASDIVVVIGDKTFGSVQNLINSLTPRGPIKKLIVIGSQQPQYLLNQDYKEVVYSFKDMYDYCASDRFKKKNEYNDPKFVEIDFPWLVETLKNLQEILNGMIGIIGEENKRHLYNYVRMIFSDINFSKTVFENFKVYFCNYIDENIEDVSVGKKLKEWINFLSYDCDSNPKLDYSNAQNGNRKIITPRKSIARQVRGGWGYYIYLDAPIHRGDNSSVDDITMVMRYHNFAKIVGLYYTGIESGLKTYSERNLKKDPLYSIVNEFNEQDRTNNFNLDDYIVTDEIENYIKRIYRYDQNVVEFTDGDSLSIDGKVLLWDMDKEYCELRAFDDIDKPNGRTITYYSSNSSNSDMFDQLFKHYLGLPEDGDIDTYSNLWHRKLKEYLGDDEIKKEQFCKKINISSQILKNQLDGISKFIQSNSSMEKALNILLENNKIDDKQKEYIMKARKCNNSESISFGAKLKSSLLKYKMNGEMDAEITYILGDLNINIDNIVNEFLYTKKINAVNYGR